MRYLPKICLLSVAVVVSASNPDTSTSSDEITATPDETSSTSVTTATADTVTGSETSELQDLVPDGNQAPVDDVSAGVAVVAVNPLLGEIMTELILNIERAIDNYVFEMELEEAAVEAVISTASDEPPSQQPEIETTSAPTDDASTSDGSAESTLPATESSSYPTYESSTTPLSV